MSSSPNKYNYTEYAYPSMVFPLGAISALAFLANAFLVGYIVWRRVYNNYISSHFIVHLCLTNMLGLSLLLPLFLANLWSGSNIWANSNFMCRIQVEF